jgi:hypothetical protein
MIKAEIFNSEVSLNHGVFRSDNAELLELLELLSDDFHRQTGTDYYPDREHALMSHICKQTKGSITFYEEPFDNGDRVY